MSMTRSVFERRQHELDHSSSACGTYLSLSEPVVHNVHEPGGPHDVAHARCQFCATLWGRCLGKVNYLEVCPFDCKKGIESMSTVRVADTGARLTGCCSGRRRNVVRNRWQRSCRHGVGVWQDRLKDGDDADKSNIGGKDSPSDRENTGSVRRPTEPTMPEVQDGALGFGLRVSQKQLT